MAVSNKQNVLKFFACKKRVEEKLTSEIVLDILNEHMPEIENIRKINPGPDTQHIIILYESAESLEKRIIHGRVEKSKSLTSGNLKDKKELLEKSAIARNVKERSEYICICIDVFMPTTSLGWTYDMLASMSISAKKL